jgi:uncharacterized coiled-coil protein SlyX
MRDKQELTKEERMAKVLVKMEKMRKQLDEDGAPEMSIEEISRQVRNITERIKNLDNENK